MVPWRNNDQWGPAAGERQPSLPELLAKELPGTVEGIGRDWAKDIGNFRDAGLAGTARQIAKDFERGTLMTDG